MPMHIAAPAYFGMPYAFPVDDPEVPAYVRAALIRHGYRFAVRLPGCWQGLKTEAEVKAEYNLETR